MREIFLDDYIEEVKGAENVSYLLKKNEYFFMTGYKVLQGKNMKGLVECARLKYNGREKIVYFSASYVSLKNMISRLDIVGLKVVLRNLFYVILHIQSNGFLKCENLEIDPGKIFIDRNTMEVYLIYLPIKIMENEFDRNAFENSLRMQLIRLLNSMGNINESGIKDIIFELSNGTASLEYLYRYFQQDGASYHVAQQQYSQQGHRQQSYTQSSYLQQPLTQQSLTQQPSQISRTGESYKTWVLASVDGRYKFEIRKEEFLIGKSAGTVDGVINGNSAISRVHCKVISKNGQCYMCDMNSSNGTYVNGRRLNPQEKVAIQQGSSIRIANIEFLIR